ncbi:mpv17-like protein 2 [Halyomorpha halys]|uniref:mpv17-like protein 2 n=1 Tax=Halyomorpha halys TaxID=286706 RepID=UPI0006D4FD1A|nr:mpv17-like protein 2 [Halyomorpha halys]
MRNVRFLHRLSAAYKKFKHIKDVMFSKKYLFFTNMGISVGLSGIGDMTQQQYMILKGEKKTWDEVRTGHMSITGFTVGVVCHKWYMFLDKKLPGRTVKIVLKKVLVDQIFFSPVYISVFFLTSGLLDKSSLKDIGNEIIEKGKQLYVAEWVVWPPAQLFNFFFLPTKYRIFYDSSISFGYDIYTSYVKHDSSGKVSRAESKKSA